MHNEVWGCAKNFARLRSQYGVNMVKSVATWSKVNILAVSKDMDPKTWK